MYGRGEGVQGYRGVAIQEKTYFECQNWIATTKHTYSKKKVNLKLTKSCDWHYNLAYCILPICIISMIYTEQTHLDQMAYKYITFNLDSIPISFSCFTSSLALRLRDFAPNSYCNFIFACFHHFWSDLLCVSSLHRPRCRCRRHRRRIEAQNTIIFIHCSRGVSDCR